MRQNLKAVSGNIKKLESKLTKKINAVTAKAEQVAKEYEQIGTSLTKLSGNTIDKDALAVALALERLKLSKNFENQLAEEVSDLNQRLDSLQMEIDAIEKISDTQKQSLKKVSKKVVTRKSGTAPKTGAGSAAIPPQPGTITEKDLIE
jgi:prefoldin subunit 5